MNAVETLLAELHAALKQAHVDEDHLRIRAVARITRAYERYWKDCGATDEDDYAAHTRAARQASPGRGEP